MRRPGLALLFLLLGCDDSSGTATPQEAGGAGQGGNQQQAGTSGQAGTGGTSEGGAGGNAAGGDTGGSAGAGGDAGAGGQEASRSFALGFTPFPYDITNDAVEWTYQTLQKDGDLMAYHTTQGVAWVEASEGKGFEQYGASVQAEWKRQIEKVPPGHKVYLGLTPLDDSRSKLADYWGDKEHMPLPGAWASYTFDSPQVISAYLQFCETAIQHYQPNFLAIGIEVNLLKKQNPSAWGGYTTLQKETYLALKKKHPDLPIFVSLTAVDLLDGWTDADHAAQLEALGDILPYTDYLALSFYPYMSAHLTNPIPDDTFDKLAALAPGKPMAFAETGFPAQKTELPSFGLVFDGTTAKQDTWISRVLQEADQRKMPMVVNFVSRDYDALWKAINGDDFQAVWRDTGLYAEDGAPREALATWKSYLARPYLP